MTDIITFDATTDADFIATFYADADNATKARLRADADAAILAAVRSGDLAGAMHVTGIRDAMKTAPKAAEVDYAAMVADHYATLVAAVAAMESGDYTMPEGVSPDAAEGWTELAGTADAKAVATMTTVRGRKAGRGAVIAWIESVVDDTPTKIADLRKRWVPTTDYPKSAPSAGAIGAALNRVDDGAEADFVTVDVNGSRGVVRADA